MTKKNVITLVVVLLALGAAYYLLNSNKAFKSVTNFEECVEAGYPVMESYPRQCRGKDKTFVEDISGLPPLIDTDTPTIGDDGSGVVCTADAKICPDGTGVGRVGPNCEFAPCPGN